MSVAWHYSRGGQRHGPVSSAQLQDLARQGLLSPEDLVWKEGMEGWQKAGRLKGLFGTAPTVPPPPTPQQAATVNSPLKQGVSVLGSTAKAAGDLALKQAEKTKLQTLSLPAAYSALGQAVYEAGEQHPDTASLFAAIKELRQQLSDAKAAPAPLQDKASLGDRAVAIGKQASAAVSAKTLASKLSTQYAQLGKIAFERSDVPHHQHEKTAPIRQLHRRDEELAQQISALNAQMAAQGEQIQHMAKASALKGYSLLLSIATFFTFPLAPLSLLPIWTHPSWSRSRKLTLAALSVACTAGVLTFSAVMTANAMKAVAVANSEWDGGNTEEAIRQYRKLLPSSSFLRDDEEAQMLRRLIEFDCTHGNKDGARRLVIQAEDRNLSLDLTDPTAVAMLSEVQQKRREAEEARQRDRERVKQEQADVTPPRGEQTGKQSSMQTLSVRKALLGASMDIRNLVPQEVQISDPAMKDGQLSFRLKWINNISGGKLWHYSVYGKEGEKLDTGEVDVNRMMLGETAKVRIYIPADIRGDAQRVDVHY